MKKYQLGEFEEIVMLTVGILYDEAYGVAIKQEIKDRLNRKVSVGALQSALRRLEKKGFLTSRKGETNSKRGGRPKLFFQITALGQRALEYSRDSRNQLWDAIPQSALKLKIS
ncbi:PadR family transcriptional regulator [Flavilitoribacter nigricans]|uniref:PadR family transcriptional regulator n=1 Tax=Flavilitoribacter nigricans (strain ATCC 23147 / DSM 23189 / NBRC 102662 / NCIMB 1420 / SS-2) TaxID=1122177 RepID=A0A2D0N9Y8_FLAN2|nr:helix-turn-helix transcriptional regulator [Flavilitoribacter nigricans]PHN05295.1 PadR family transcriptional regulator [Flavilitoribacter nigricans DSM 23189 = NBRC 102662]